MVVFYVKDKVSKARDGYEVAGLLKEKIGNEEGFFEFGLLKVEPYSKYLYSLHNRCYFFTFLGERRQVEVSEEHQTGATGEGIIFSERRACLTLLARFALAFVRPRKVKK